MKLIVIILAFVFFLTACKPPVIIDPEPVVPDPVVVSSEIEGMWVGVFSSEEGFFFSAALEFVVVSPTLIEGTIELLDEPEPTFGTLKGSQDGLLYNFAVEVVNLDEVLEFDFSGSIDEGRFVGTFSGVELTSGTVSLSKRSEP